LLFIDGVDQPFNTLVKAFLAEGGAGLNVPCAIRNVHKLEVLHNSVGGKSKLKVLLVGEDKEGHFLEVWLLEQGHKFLRALFETHVVSRVDHVDEAISVLVVVFPVGSDLALTSNVPHVQLEAFLRLSPKKAVRFCIPSTISTYQRLNVESLRGHDLIDVFLAHRLQDGRLSRVVQAEHQNPGLLVTFLQAAKQIQKSH
jgi:hypothetical protein